MEKVIVTGGAGYVGSVLVPMLLKDNYKVSVLDSMIHENNYNLMLNYVDGTPITRHPNFGIFKKGDVRNEGLVKELINNNDSVIHLAAIVGAPACDKYKDIAETTNLGGTRNIISNISKNQKIIFASTGSNYGKIEGICDENSPLNPLSLYGVTKTKAENMIVEKSGVAYRFATAFGLSPRLRTDLLINDFTNQLVNSKHLDVYECDARRTFVHVSDMAKAFIFGLENYDFLKGNSFNIGDDSMNATKGEAAEIIKNKIIEKFNFEPYLWMVKKGFKEGYVDPDQRDYEVSYKKINDAGFKVETSLNEGLDELVDFFANFKMRNPFGNI